MTGYDAGPGYDQMTGWGSVDIAEFAQAFGGPLPVCGHAASSSPPKSNFGKLAVNQSKTMAFTLSNPESAEGQHQYQLDHGWEWLYRLAQLSRHLDLRAEVQGQRNLHANCPLPPLTALA